MDIKPYYSEPGITIYHGDCRSILPHLPKVDLVLTDPPYLKEYLWAYSTVAESAKQLLPEGGWCFAYGSGEHLPDHIARMAQHLDYYWIFTLLHHGGWPRMWNKKLLSGYKPVLVFTKGKPSINPWMGTVHTDSMDKAHHDWGQGAGFSLKIIQMLTPNNGIILDPFMGGGTSLFAARQLGRKAIGIEIEKKYCDIAIDRLRQEVLPLTQPEVNQVQEELL